MADQPSNEAPESRLWRDTFAQILARAVRPDYLAAIGDAKDAANTAVKAYRELFGQGVHGLKLSADAAPAAPAPPATSGKKQKVGASP